MRDALLHVGVFTELALQAQLLPAGQRIVLKAAAAQSRDPILRL